MPKCPVCGTRLDIAKTQRILTPRQRQLRDIVEALQRDLQRDTIRTELIAAAVGLHPKTINPDLRRLEDLEELCRPSGPKSGWSLHREEIALIRAA